MHINDTLRYLGYTLLWPKRLGRACLKWWPILYGITLTRSINSYCPFFNTAASPRLNMSTDFGRRAFTYSFPAAWNSIHTSIKNC